MSVYLSIYGFFAALSLPNAKKSSFIYLTISFLFFAWFAGLRFFVGCDYYAYGVRFANAAHNELADVLSKGEVSFHLLTYWSSEIFGSYNIFLFTASSIVFFLFLRFASNFKEVRFILTLFIPVLIIKLGMSGLRQAIAVGFVCLAYIAFVNVKRLKCAAFVLAGATFHTTAIIFLPLALMAGRKFNVAKIAAALVIASIPVALFLSDRIGLYQDRYINQIYGAQESSGAWIRYILNVLPVPVFFMRRKYFEQKYPELYNLLMLGALMIAASAILGAISSVALHRILYYLMPLSILLCVCTLDLFQNRAQGKLMWIGIYFVYMFTWFATSRHADACFIPYQNVTFFTNYAPDWFSSF